MMGRVFAVIAMLTGIARADVAMTQVGFTNGDDWEPAIAVDGSFIYVA